MAKKTRHWSRAFEPRTDRDVKLTLSRIPPTLKERFAAKCKREGCSQRNLLLSWMQNWADGRRPDDPGEKAAKT